MSFLSRSAIAVVPFLLFQPIAIAAPKLSAEATIDQIFRSSALLPGEKPETRKEIEKLKSGVIQWLGNYQETRIEKGRPVIIFERGSVPVTVKFKANGEPESIGAECPVTSVPLSQAPKEFQEALAPGCPKLKR